MSKGHTFNMSSEKDGDGKSTNESDAAHLVGLPS